MFHVLLEPGLENFEHYFGSVWDECSCVVVWTFFGIAFLWDWNENWPFPVLWLLLSFPGVLAYSLEWIWRVQHFHSIAFRIWNSSTGVPSPPLVFSLMLPKAHLPSHSRMSGSRWVITLSWLSGSWRSFLYSSSVYSCHLFLISSASVRSVPFPSLVVPIFAWNVALVSLIFLEKISSLSHSVVFLYFFAWSLRKAFLSLLAFLWNSACKWVYLFFSPLPFIAICKASSDNHFTFLYFFFLGMVLIPVSCTMLCTSIHNSSGTVSDLIPWVYLSLPLYNHKGFDLGPT